MGLLLWALYWATASGAFHSIDEQAVFAVSRNLVLHGEWNQSILFWDAPYSEQARLGLDGEMHSKYGIGHSLLVAVVLAGARLIPGVLLGPSAMALSMAATALTGALLVLIAARLGYGPRVGVTLALLFGGATFAWVYARTMFSEPLIGLAWTAALWRLLAVSGSRNALTAGLILAVAVTVRPVSVLFVPWFALLLWPSTLRSPSSGERENQLKRFGQRLVAFGLPIGLAVAGLLAFNQLRFGDPFEFGYSETFDGSLVTGLSGFAFSLDRSLFLFAPPLVALAWSTAAFLPRHRRVGGAVAGVGLASLLIFSLWPVFWGGPVWGPRYLLPAVPLLVVLLAPAVEEAWARAGWQRWALGLLAVVGVAMQLPGVLWNALPETQRLGQRYPLWQLLPQAVWVDVAWWVGHPEALALTGVLAALALALLRWHRRWLLVAASVATGVSLPLLLVWLSEAGLGSTPQPGYEALVARLNAQAGPRDTLVVNPAPYQAPLDDLIWFMNQPRLTPSLYAIYRLPPEEVGRTEAQLSHLLRSYERLWLLTRGVAPGDPTSSTEQWLVTHAPVVATEWLEGESRLTLLEASRPATVSAAPAAPLGNAATLAQWVVVAPGALESSLQLSLEWRPEGPTASSLHTFAQLLDEQGQLIAGWDGVPQAGFAPSTNWKQGEIVRESLVLSVPPPTPAATLRLVVGLYDPATGQRLRAGDGSDTLLLTTVSWPFENDE